MSTEQHTLGRLGISSQCPTIIKQYDELGESNVMIASVMGGETSGPGFPEAKATVLANARRIVACWNACHGISTEMLSLLEVGGLQHIAASTFDERMTVNQLLTCVEELVEAFGKDGHGGEYEDGECPVIDRARAAIAKARGQA